MSEEKTLNPETETTPVEAVETAVSEETNNKASKPSEPETAHDDFDWTISNRNQYVYSKDDRDRLEKLYDKTLGAVNESEVIKARVNQITGGDAVLDIGFKSDGSDSMSEFKDNEGLKIGDEVAVYNCAIRVSLLRIPTPHLIGLMPSFFNSVMTMLAVIERSLLLCIAIALPLTFSNAASMVASFACASALLKSW